MRPALSTLATTSVLRSVQASGGDPVVRTVCVCRVPVGQQGRASGQASNRFPHHQQAAHSHDHLGHLHAINAVLKCVV